MKPRKIHYCNEETDVCACGWRKSRMTLTTMIQDQVTCVMCQSVMEARNY